MILKNRWKLISLLGVFLLGFLTPAKADLIESNEEFLKGKVLEVGEIQTKEIAGYKQGTRPITVGLQEENGTLKKLVIEQEINLETKVNEGDLLKQGDKVVISAREFEGKIEYSIYEPYRLDGLLFIFLIFILFVVFITGKKGLWALVGLILTFLILIKWMIPKVLAGSNPVLMSFIASVLIAIITFYLAHGFKKRTTLALFSTLGTLVIAFILSILSVEWVQLLGTGSEEAASLSFGGLEALDLKGLLLGAIVIGTLGVLDDVTVTQISTVHEIHKANESLDFKELYKRGLSVGRDHIVSILNTLVLAYAGASFPALILLVSSPWPLWMTLNNEFMAEEIVRTLVGTMTLIIAVPISTMLAAYLYSRKAPAQFKKN